MGQVVLVPSDSRPYDEFGRSVAVHQDFAFIAANSAVYAYGYDGFSWREAQRLVVGDVFFYGPNRYSVDVSENTAIISAVPLSGNAGAFIFRRSGSAWHFEQRLSSENTHELGRSLAIEGNVAIVRGLSLGPTYQRGVYVFRFDGARWVHEATLAPSEQGAANFGHAVALTGSTIFVGSPLSYNPSGAVYVFSKVGAHWVQQQRIPGPPGSYRFGDTLAASGTSLFISSSLYGKDGRVFIFRLRGATWVLEQVIAAPPETGDYHVFGESLAAAGGTAVVGVPMLADLACCNCYCEYFDYACPCEYAYCGNKNCCNCDYSAFESGFAQVLEFDGSGWRPVAILAVNPNELVTDVGCAVDVDGQSILIGASGGYQLQSVPEVGRAYVTTGTPDCNANGTADDADVSSGRSQDCDHNGVPDECQPDCNHNRIMDRCETGACCIGGAPFGACVASTASECDLIGGAFMGPCAECLRQAPTMIIEPGTTFVHIIGQPVSCSPGRASVAATAAACTDGPFLDPWVSPPDARMCHNFGSPDTQPIPPDFFGPGSDPFSGLVCLTGVSLANPAFGEADTLIRRMADPFDRCELPSPSPRTVEIEIAALSLASVSPITVTYNAGQSSEDWDVAVDLSPTGLPTGTPGGSVTALKTHCNGGTYTSQLSVQPRFTFTKVADPTTVRVLDTAESGVSPIHLDQQTPFPWVSDIASGYAAMVDVCSDFHPGIEETVFEPSCDCNNNLIRDRCDIESGLSADCDDNHVPDECDVASGRVPDRNADLIPDTCQFRDFISCLTGPVDTQGLAATCLRFDCNVDGDVDLRDFARYVRELGCGE